LNAKKKKKELFSLSRFSSLFKDPFTISILTRTTHTFAFQYKKRKSFQEFIQQ